MFLRHSGCSLLAVVSMSVTIGCLWCCICAMAWIADCESVNMTMLFTHVGLGLSQSFEMVCKAERIALGLHHSCYNVVRTLH